MSETVRDVMTPYPAAVSADTTLADTARLMRDKDIGDVLVTRGDRLVGIVTDRDVTVRATAEGLDPTQTPVEVCLSSDLVVVGASDDVDDALRALRDHAIRRVPVVDGDIVVGIVSIGDLSREPDAGPALAAISAAPASD
jgi:CBS domain-containing protein